MHTHKYIYIHVGSPIQTYLHKQTYTYTNIENERSLYYHYIIYMKILMNTY